MVIVLAVALFWFLVILNPSIVHPTTRRWLAPGRSPGLRVSAVTILPGQGQWLIWCQLTAYSRGGGFGMGRLSWVRPNQIPSSFRCPLGTVENQVNAL